MVKRTKLAGPVCLLFMLALITTIECAAEKAKPQSEIPVDKQRLLPATKLVKFTGEVVDAWCYSSQVMGPGRGEKHKACALACAHGGVSLGVVDEKTGEMFIAAKYRGYTGCKELLLPFVAKRVVVEGWAARKGGCNVLKIKSVALADGEIKTNAGAEMKRQAGAEIKRQGGGEKTDADKAKH